jgi:ATP-binding cassette, subfamily B, bacterial
MMQSAPREGTAEAVSEAARAGRKWVRRLLPYLRSRPGNLMLAFTGFVVAGLVGAGQVLLQRQLLDLALAGRTAAVVAPLLLLLGLCLPGYLAQRLSAYRELLGANDVQFQVYDAVHRRMQHIDGDGQTVSPGQLAARLNADINTMSRAVATLPRLAGTAVAAAVTAALMLTLHPLLGAVSLLVMPLQAVVIRKARTWIRPATWHGQEREADVAQLAATAIAGVRVVKALGQERREIERMAAASDALYTARMRRIRIQALYAPVLESFSGILQVIVVLLGGWLMLRGELSLGTLLAFSVCNNHLVQSVRWFAETAGTMQEAGVCAGRVLDLLDLPPAVVERPAARALPALRGEVCLDRVRFGYRDAPPVLNGLSLRIAPGETVALVGGAGSGKSTVVKLLGRFHDPQAGAVTLDGVDLRDVTLDSLRGQVGVVFDEPMLFTGTIKDTIAFGRPDADDAEVIAAADDAGAHEFITGLPDGYATVIGERGYTLSGGQRQRLVLARTLLTDPSVLVLDDPTAGVDPELEWEIHRRLRQRRGDRTTIFVGYRPSTLAIADRIVVLDAGRVVDEGRHEELLERCERYRHLVDPDAAREAIEATLEPTRPSSPPATARESTPPVPEKPEPPAETFSAWRLFRPHRLVLAAVLALLAVQTALGVASPYLTREAIDNGILAGSMRSLTGAALSILAATLIGLSLAPLTAVLAGRVGQRVVRSLRLRVWTRVLRLPISFYEGQRAGRLLTRVHSDVESFSQFASIGMVSGFVSAATLIGVLVVMLVVSPLLAGLVVAAMLPYVLLLVRSNRKIRRAYLSAREQMGEANAALQENLAGVREAQALRQLDRQHAEYRRLVRSHLDHRLAAERVIAATFVALSFLSNLALIMVVGVGAVLLGRGSLSPGDLIAFVLLVSLVFPPIVQLGSFYTMDLKRVEVSARMIRSLLAEDVGPPAPASPVRLPALRGDLRIAGVRFRYPGTRTDVLHDIDLAVPAGSTVALVGPTGVGKSTICKLLARFYDPTEGQVLLDGVDLRSVDPAVFRARLGYLPQEPYLFTGTIRENIAYGRPDASDADIEAAARAVGAHAGIRGLPDGYEHVVGERGGGLSAGLRQLVCLARAYLVDPAVVLLDEATARLDLATEARVLAAIRTLTRGRTTVLVAHRLQTAMTADHIAVLGDGRIEEWGTHDDLVAAGGRYARLYAASMRQPAPVA